MAHSLKAAFALGASAAIFACALGAAPQASAECSTQNHVAIVIFDTIYPAFAPQFSTLSVTVVGPAVYPTWEQLEGPLMQYFHSGAGLAPNQVAGNIWYWTGVYGSEQALVDRRDGAVLFGGTAVWMGEGHVLCPLESTHTWSTIPGAPAAEPASVATIANNYWENALPSATELTAAALSYLRTTDFVHSFADCGDYQVVGYVYTPAVGATILEMAKLIIAIDGTVGAPWNGQPVSAEPVNWGGLKASYR